VDSRASLDDVEKNNFYYLRLLNDAVNSFAYITTDGSKKELEDCAQETILTYFGALLRNLGLEGLRKTSRARVPRDLR
jgi:hypothetical protein